MNPSDSSGYRGRIAPSPTGLLHLGHARTFWIAQMRARNVGGSLILRDEDLDASRARPEFAHAMIEDLKWFGFKWSEGPDRGGPFAPYKQSERHALYVSALEKLDRAGVIYPCTCSRKDLQNAPAAPHDEEAIYPGTCRGNSKLSMDGRRYSWRFRVPDGEAVEFTDGRFGRQCFTAGRDFGDFIVWRHDGVPSYQLAVAVDDNAMRITEVVRGADLLVSTARQLLLYRSLELQPPEFFHCPLLTDDHGVRLAKRHDALSLRQLREQGRTPEELMASWNLQEMLSTN